MPKKYLLYIHDERFADEEKKSELINALLAEWYTDEPLPSPKLKLPPIKKRPPSAKKEKVPALLAIPGVERASEAKCKGSHYMSRVDCGKPGCPWFRSKHA
jgi:hypothetical protein